MALLRAARLVNNIMRALRSKYHARTRRWCIDHNGMFCAGASFTQTHLAAQAYQNEHRNKRGISSVYR